jgi:hypothetical protein
MVYLLFNNKLLVEGVLMAGEAKKLTKRDVGKALAGYMDGSYEGPIQRVSLEAAIERLPKVTREAVKIRWITGGNPHDWCRVNYVKYKDFYPRTERAMGMLVDTLNGTY